MKRRQWKAILSLLAMVVGLVLASSVHAQDPELFLMSYPNANITVDGDASDWNLDQFGTIVVGGVAAGGDEFEWDRVTGTGDIALLGWDDGEQDVFYGSKFTQNVLPEDRADNAAKFYARDNETHQYFLVDIIDNEINTDDVAAWANDSVEFYFDPTNDRGETPGGDPAWESDVQLVIDAGNEVQVWNSPVDYEVQIEDGVESAVTITEKGWLLEVGIDKSVFDPPLPAVLGPANDPANYGIDLSYRDNDDPDATGTRNGDPLFSTNYIWADPTPAGAFPSKLADNWGQMIAGVGGGPTPLKAGDADMDLDFDQLDLVQVQIAAKYLTGQAATWAEGDWDGAPGGEQGSPPTGNGLFDQLDIIEALGPGHYLTGPYGALAPEGGVEGDAQTSLVYDPATGGLAVDAPAGTELTSINIDSASGIFTGNAAENLGGSFDNDADGNIFKATFGGSFGSISFGDVAVAGLSEEFVRGDLSVVGSLAGGGDLGNVDLIYVPEPSTLVLIGLGLLAMLPVRRRLTT